MLITHTHTDVNDIVYYVLLTLCCLFNLSRHTYALTMEFLNWKCSLKGVSLIECRDRRKRDWKREKEEAREREKERGRRREGEGEREKEGKKK